KRIRYLIGRQTERRRGAASELVQQPSLVRGPHADDRVLRREKVRDVHRRSVWRREHRAFDLVEPSGSRESDFLVRRPQPVADASLRENIMWTLGIGFDLLPE